MWSSSLTLATIMPWIVKKAKSSNKLNDLQSFAIIQCLLIHLPSAWVSIYTAKKPSTLSKRISLEVISIARFARFSFSSSIVVSPTTTVGMLAFRVMRRSSTFCLALTVILDAVQINLNLHTLIYLNYCSMELII
jgi:hypothetical protein